MRSKGPKYSKTRYVGFLYGRNRNGVWGGYLVFGYLDPRVKDQMNLNVGVIYHISLESQWECGSFQESGPNLESRPQVVELLLRGHHKDGPQFVETSTGLAEPSCFEILIHSDHNAL